MLKTLRSILPMLLLASVVSAQNVVVGIVKDNKGAPVSGATIGIRGSAVYAAAGPDGKFSITTTKKLPFYIRVTSLGYTPQEIQVTEISATPLEIALSPNNFLLTEIAVTARRRNETAQDVPIPISVVGGALIEESGDYNVNRVKEMVPTLQLYTSNPRNTTLNIRGLGSTFGLTNDGIEPGVGFYVDGVYYARPAAATLDFIDVEQIEVLRGPQGTLFGKNTTAGALNITTRKPDFTPGAKVEVSYGNYGYVQAKSSITGPLVKNKLAGRLSFSGTQRDGVLYNVSTQQHVNDLNNLGLRGQLLFTPTENVKITAAGDLSRQRPNGYAQVVAGVVKTMRPAYRQFDQIIADLHYQLPSQNPFDRLIDHNTTWLSNNDLGGASLNVDIKLGQGTLTSTTAWRYWNWDPSNDRDFTALPVLQLSQAPSAHQQWSQEVRYAGNFSSKLSGVIGVFALGQNLKSDPVQTEESGSAQARFSQSTTDTLWQTPGLFDGYGIQTRSSLKTFSGAIFGQLDWTIVDRLHILPGIRFNYDKKKVYFDRQTYGGLQTEDPKLIALKEIVYTSQTFNADADDNNWSGQLTLAYKPSRSINTFATFSTSYKPIGVNLGGLPRSNGVTMIELAQIKPEYVTHFEVGLKSNPTPFSTVNITLYNTDIKDYQTQVQTPDPGVNRGYLANAEKVRVRGAEFDGNIRFKDNFSLYGAFAYTDGKYVTFKNAPVPLEETGSPVAFKDISNTILPGISKWSGSLGGEALAPGNFLGLTGRYFLGLDGYYRSSFSSSPSESKFLNIDGYALVNARIGFRALEGVNVSLWARNLLDKDYFEQLLPASGGAGHYAGVLGDPRTFGITIGYAFGSSNL